MTPLTVVSKSPEETTAIGAALAPLLRAGDVLLLDGEMAAGKTCFVAALVGALGSPDPVTSPTFAIAQFYAGAACPILHLDVWRLAGLPAFRDLALDDHFADSIVAVEWGERVAAAFPVHLSLRFAIAGEGRLVTITGVGERWRVAWPALTAALAP